MQVRADSVAFEAARAGPGRRLGAWLADVALIVVTLGIGWLIWYCVTAARGQSPGKRLLSLYVVRADGEIAGFGWMLLRDLLVRAFAFATLDLILLTLLGDSAIWFVLAAFAATGAWCVWDANGQCLWDKVARTRVAFIPKELGEAAGRARESGRL